MTVSAPAVLVVGLVLAVALGALAVVLARRRAAALAAAGATASKRVPAGVWVTLVGLALLALAAAGPVAKVPVPRSAGTVVVAIDVSNSMAATDVKPSRLAAAKKAAQAFIAAQPESVDVGVVAFQQGALTTSKPDGDHALAAAAVNRLKVAGGTSLGSAVLASLSAITGRNVALGRNDEPPRIGTWRSATVVLFSDGEDRGRQGSLQAAATTAENAGVHVDTVGVGTTGGATVDADGYRVHSSLHDETLTAIARTTGGQYHPASDTAQLNGVASSIDLRLTVKDEDLPLAGGVVGLAVLLLAVGAGLTLLRTGRLI